MPDLKGRKIEAMYAKFGVFVGKTCAECPHLIRRHYAGFVGYKCCVYGISASVATDWRLKWTACGAFDKVHDANATPIYKTLPKIIPWQDGEEKIPVCEGQITMEEWANEIHD